MKTLTHWGTLGVVSILALASSQVIAENSAKDSLDTEFVDNGRITMQLSAGTHDIIASPDNHIRVRWSVSKQSDLKKVDARTDVNGSSAKIDIEGEGNNFRTVIEVPRHSDLVVRVTAGDLSIEEIIGDKDIRLRAGDLSIEVGDADNYAHVEGSLWAGDIDAGPFKYDSGGLFRSIEWQGSGKHELRFHLYAGDVKLY
jgi:hypothetical protein